MRKLKILPEKNFIKKSKKHYLVWSYLLLVIALQVLMAIQTSSRGAKLSDLENSADTLLTEQQNLKSILVESSSITLLNQNAENFGYAKVDKTYFINVDNEFAALKNDQ